MKIKVKVELYDKMLEDMGIEDTRVVDMIIETDHIIATRPSVIEGEVSDIESCIYTISGETFIVRTPFSYLDRILYNDQQ